MVVPKLSHAAAGWRFSGQHSQLLPIWRDSPRVAPSPGLTASGRVSAAAAPGSPQPGLTEDFMGAVSQLGMFGTQLISVHHRVHLPR